jgi:hypothetical protein
MTRRVFNTSCDVFNGPDGVSPDGYIGTFPCRLVPQLAINPTGIGSVVMGYWLTLDGYCPRGAWTPDGFGMDASLSDQIAVPTASGRQYWVVYTDQVIWHALTPYYRCYLSTLPLPPRSLPRSDNKLILGVGHLPPRPEILLSIPSAPLRILRYTGPECPTPRIIWYTYQAGGRIQLCGSRTLGRVGLVLAGLGAGGPTAIFETQSIAGKAIVLEMTIGPGVGPHPFPVSGPWTAPPGITSVRVDAWGCGGAGGDPGLGSVGGGGGGSGAYGYALAYSVVPGITYNVVVGTPSGYNSSYFDLPLFLEVQNGSPGSEPNGGMGGAVFHSGDGGYTGATGSDAYGGMMFSYGGDGASAPGPGGGIGGAGGNGFGDGSPGGAPGAGGGGGDVGYSGAAGGNGLVILTY